MKNSVSTPSVEILTKIQNARTAVQGRASRKLLCPYCKRSAIVVFDDARGHIQCKCHKCGKETVVDVVNMRREKISE